MAPMILHFYSTINGETAKLKADASVFTIADGIVQALLQNHLFCGKFANIVGEEDDCKVDIRTRPFKVDELTVPEEFCDMVDAVRVEIDRLAESIHPDAYKSLTVFIDPIDGTREFSTGLGEQCSVCIGFSDSTGKPIAGIVYRPITQPPTWAAGALSENFVASNLNLPAVSNPRGLLTSNGAISPFIGKLIEELDFVRVPSGGAGNKMLMLLEGKGAAYIQDRGVSRWDTAGAQAVIEAHGGTLSKLTGFVAAKSLASYTYLKSPLNLDFEAGKASLTPYNAADKRLVKKGAPPVLAEDAGAVKAYSNLCGLFALDRSCVGTAQLDLLFDAIQRTIASGAQPAYD